MTRRILAALVGLTAVLLAGVVVPLGLFTVHHDEQVYLERADASALGVANRAEERIADGKRAEVNGVPGRLYVPTLNASAGDRTSVYDIHGRPLAGSSRAVPLSPSDQLAALRGTIRHRWTDNSNRLLVVVPVTSGGTAVGVAALSRSAGPLHAETQRLWLGLAVAGLVALAAATGLSLALARWVSRPMRRLESAAARLGEGTLSARAPTVGGPAELKQLSVTFNRMAGRLESLLASQRTVVADVSHQLRTPLAALRLRLELLRQDAEGAVSGDLDGTLLEVNRLSRLLDGMLAVSRAENANPTPRVIDVAAVATGRVDAWAPVAADTQVSLSIEADAACALATPGHLEQILDNLLANAIEACPPGGHITVKVAGRQRAAAAGAAEQSGHRVRISVSDDGPGMSAPAQENALRRFWTEGPGDPAVPRDRQGSGLGLAIADRLASVDQGCLKLQDAPGGGLLATVDLPAAEPAVA